MTMKCSCAPLVCGKTDFASSPIRLTASWKRQCEWTSMVLTRLPLTMTGRAREWKAPTPDLANAMIGW
jgi:hypothetical protein